MSSKTGPSKFTNQYTYFINYYYTSIFKYSFAYFNGLYRKCVEVIESVIGED